MSGGFFDTIGNTLNEGLSEWLGIGQEKAAQSAVTGVHQQSGNAVNADGSNLEQQKQAMAEQIKQQNTMKLWLIGGGVVLLLVIVLLFALSNRKG